MTVKLNRQFYSDPTFHILLFIPVFIWLFVYKYNPSISQFEKKYLISVILIIPIIEEVIFRGLLQTWIAKRYNQVVGQLSLANLITSSIFALLHLFTQPLSMALYTFIPSLIFGYAKDRYKRLMPSIILHSSYNGGYFLIGT